MPIVGWEADRAVLRALAEVERKVDRAAVNAAVAAVYRPWLDPRAYVSGSDRSRGERRHIQGCLRAGARPGDVVAFVDGLRLDVGHALVSRIAGVGLTADLTIALAALPTVTRPLSPRWCRSLPGNSARGRSSTRGAFPPARRRRSQVLRKLMEEAGVQVLGADDLGDPAATAWTEAGEIDQRGHMLGLELAHHIDDLVDRVARRVRELLAAGWQKVTIVTDHGWHLVPGGLPKNEGLPVAATAEEGPLRTHEGRRADRRCRPCPGIGTRTCGSRSRRESGASRRTKCTSTAASAHRSASSRGSPSLPPP